MNDFSGCQASLQCIGYSVIGNAALMSFCIMVEILPGKDGSRNTRKRIAPIHSWTPPDACFVESGLANSTENIKYCEFGVLIIQYNANNCKTIFTLNRFCCENDPAVLSSRVLGVLAVSSVFAWMECAD